MVATTLLVCWTSVLGAPAAPVSAPAVATLAEVAALPEFARIVATPTPVILRGALGQAAARRAQREAARVLDDVGRRFLAAGEAGVHPAVDLCLFEGEAAYVAFTLRVCGPIPDCSPL